MLLDAMTGNTGRRGALAAVSLEEGGGGGVKILKKKQDSNTINEKDKKRQKASLRG